MNKQDFINQIVPFITKYCQQYHYPFVSPILAQAILESAWGSSYKAITGYNYFGLKYQSLNRVPSASGYFTDGGSEQKANGTYIQLDPNVTRWCKFASMEDGVRGYFEFLINAPGNRYAALPKAISPFDYLQKIKDAGYATSLNYVTNLSNVISANNLTQYDIFVNNTIPIQQQPINIIEKCHLHNTTAAPNRKIEFIVIHYTAGTRSSGNAAENVANWFANAQCQASADYIVDDNHIVQYNPDVTNRYCWSVGGKQYTNKATSLAAQYYGVAKNINTINIEICSNKHNTASLNATDTDWYFTEESVNNAIRLTKYLMQAYSIAADHVIMHHSVTGKICPSPWCVTETALVGWRNFLKKLGAAEVPNTTQPVAIPNSQAAAQFTVKVLVPDLNIRQSPNGKKIGKFTGKGIFTIVDTDGDWGLLKAYTALRNGWIYLGNAKYTQRL